MHSVLAFVLLFVALGLAQPIPPSMPITHFAILTPDQESLAVDSDANGVAIFSYNSGTKVLLYQVIHNVASPTASHIHGPAYPGTDAAVSFAFPNFTSPITGTTTLSVAQAGYLTSGQMYVNVHSTAYSGGEIRGQILSQGQSVVAMLGSYSVPTTPSTASGHAFVTYNSAAKTVSWNITHNVVNCTLLHFHGPANFTNTAGVEITVAGTPQACVSPVVGTSAALSGTVPSDLTSGLTYLNLHSQLYSGGEIRGQVQYSNVNYAVGLNGQQDGVTTPNIGAAVLSLSSDNTMLNVVVMSTIPAVTLCHIHGPGAPGVTADPLVTLEAETFSNNYYIPVNSATVNAITSGNAYVNVHTTANPAGEIRGQIAPLGTAAIPVSTTAAGSTTAVSTTAGTPANNGSDAHTLVASIAMIVASVLALII